MRREQRAGGRLSASDSPYPVGSAASSGSTVSTPPLLGARAGPREFRAARRIDDDRAAGRRGDVVADHQLKPVLLSFTYTTSEIVLRDTAELPGHYRRVIASHSAAVCTLTSPLSRSAEPGPVPDTADRSDR